MDTSQNSSLTQITQKVTAIPVTIPDNCLSAERRLRRQNPLRRFGIPLNQVSIWPTAGSTNVLMRLFHKLILQPSAQFSCCQLLITKLSVTIYISALYKPTIVSIDVITLPMYIGHKLWHDFLQKVIILVLFNTMNFTALENQGQLLYSPRTSTCRTVTHSVHWQVANWMEI